jgi:archaellum component FlaC
MQNEAEETCKQISARKEKLRNLKEKLKELMYISKSDTEDSTPRKLVSNNLQEPETIELDKLRKRVTERKQLVANALTFISRISHQLEKYNYSNSATKGKQGIFLNSRSSNFF